MSDNANLVGEDEFMLTKSAIAAVSGFGVSTIVRAGVNRIVPMSDLSLIRKVPVAVATFGLVGAVSSIVDKSNSATFDDLVEIIRAIKTAKDEAVADSLNAD